MMQTQETADTADHRPAHAGYRVVIEPGAQSVRAVFGGDTVAESTRVLVMYETRLPPVFYFPRDDVRMDLLLRSDQRTHCPFKGDASYWTLTVGDRTVRDAAWSYEDPFDESSSVKDYVAFDWDVMDAWLADGEELSEKPRNLTQAKANPLVAWLIQDAWKAKSARDLVKQLTDALLEADFPLWRLNLFIRTLHPQLFANTYTWQRDTNEVAVSQATHAGVQSAQYRDSPIALIINGEGGIRRRLDGPDPRLDFGILRDLALQGATDYVAMPLRFSDGEVNIITLASDRPGGFATDKLGELYEILPTLGGLLEGHAQRQSSLTLLRTYLGRSAGERVMNGLVKRGDGEDLHAVIWFCDLRDSTSLASALSREEYLATLDQFFDSVAGAVIDHGGEVLKFIGDAVLAIFLIDDPTDSRPEACTQALDAVKDAGLRLDAVNAQRRERAETPLAFGIGLHRGDLTYGNIGTSKRLDFTVIGPAVNQASRIEGLCKPLDQQVLVSAAFAQSVPGKLVSLGHHSLRGVEVEQEILTLPADFA